MNSDDPPEAWTLQQPAAGINPDASDGAFDPDRLSDVSEYAVSHFKRRGLTSEYQR